MDTDSGELKMRLTRLIIITSLSFFIIFIGPGTQAEKGKTFIPVATAIKNVQLYSNQAMVVRYGRVRIKKGYNRILIKDLPTALINGTVQVSVEKSRGVKIREIRIENRHMKHYKSKKAREAEKNLRRAELKLKLLTDVYLSLKFEERYLSNIRLGPAPLPKKSATRKIDSDRWIESLTFIETSLENNHSKIRALLSEIDSAREELTVALAIAERYQSVIDTSTKEVRITIESNFSRSTRLKFSYRIGNASWFPSYAARVKSGDRSKSKVRLLAYALVKNNTGEDWNNVNLTFSAADPGESANLPELYKWRIAAVSVEKKRYTRSSSSRSRRSSRRDATTVGKYGWVFEGWACAPNASRARRGISPAQYCRRKPQNYLYMKFSAAASQRAIDSGRTAMMMSTCREAARLQIAGDGLAKILGEYLEKASGVSDGQSSGVAIVSQSRGIMRGVGIYDCCAIDNNTGRCARPGKKEDWSQCMCVGYMRFAGGKRGFEAMARRIHSGGTSSHRRRYDDRSRKTEQQRRISEERRRKANARYKNARDQYRRTRNEYRRASEFFRKNKRLIKEEQARQNSYKLERSLYEFRRSIRSQENAFRRGRYKTAIQVSDNVLESIGRMDLRYRALFSKELQRSREIRKISQQLMEQIRLAQQLISPRVSSRGYDYRYSASIPETIRSDGTFRKVLILDNRLTAKLLYESAPLRKNLAFLVGKVSYKGDTPLLAGPVAVFHNADYLGESLLGNVSAKEPFQLNLGADEIVQIIRNKTGYRKETGLFKKSYNINNKIEIVVKNRKKRPITVVVYDRIPRPTNDLIKISNIKFEGAPAERLENSGLYRFRLNLGPGEVKRIKIMYQMKHATDVIPKYHEDPSYRW